MSAELSKGDILPLVNIVWNSSFGKVRTNKKAISDHGWYPANRFLLPDSDIIKSRVVDSTLSTTSTETYSLITTIPHTTAVTTTATSTAIVLPNTTSTTTTISDSITIVLPNTTATATTKTESSTTVLPNTTAATTTATDSSVIVPPSTTASTTTTTKSLTQSSSNSTIATPVYPSPWIDLSNVNFENGLTGDFTIDIIQHFAREKNVVKNLNKQYEEGTEVREGIDRTKRLIDGTMFNGNKIVLDEEILDIREKKELEKSDAKEKVIRNAIISITIIIA